MANKKFMWGILVLMLTFLISFSACEGSMGPTGKDGKDGASGTLVINPPTNTEYLPGEPISIVGFSIQGITHNNITIPINDTNTTPNYVFVINGSKTSVAPTNPGNYTVTVVHWTGNTGDFSITVIPTTLPYIDFLGIYTRTQGQYQPYIVTITRDNYRWRHDNNNTEAFINFSNITWTAADNIATTVTASEYTGILTNPSAVFPSGYTITGTRTAQGWTGTNNTYFIALSEDKQTLYVASSTSNYNRGGLANSVLIDSIYTRVTP